MRGGNKDHSLVVTEGADTPVIARHVLKRQSVSCPRLQPS